MSVNHLTSDERVLFERLIHASGRLATAADQAGAMISHEFDEVVRACVDNVRAVLDECPSPKVTRPWTGEIYEDDLKTEHFRSPGQRGGQEDFGVKLVHTPTGIGRASESKRSREENHAVALKALTKAVDAEMKRRG